MRESTLLARHEKQEISVATRSNERDDDDDNDNDDGRLTMTCANRTNDDDPSTGFCLSLALARPPATDVVYTSPPLLALPVPLVFLRDPLHPARVRMLNHKSIDVTHRRGLRYADLPPRFGLSAFPTIVSSARGWRRD